MKEGEVSILDHSQSEHNQEENLQEYHKKLESVDNLESLGIHVDENSYNRQFDNI